MTFWDSSAVLPLLIVERGTPEVQTLLRDDPDVAVWWGTEIECVSALARREREGELTAREMLAAEKGLKLFLRGALEVAPSEEVRRIARRLLLSHNLCAADAMQLAAALILGGEAIGSVRFATLDDRLGNCARREGFSAVPESA